MSDCKRDGCRFDSTTHGGLNCYLFSYLVTRQKVAFSFPNHQHTMSPNLGAACGTECINYWSSLITVLFEKMHLITFKTDVATRLPFEYIQSVSLQMASGPRG